MGCRNWGLSPTIMDTVFLQNLRCLPGKGKDRLVQVKDSMSEMEIAEMLEEKGLIRDRFLFVLQLKVSGYSGKLKAGPYTLNTSMTAEEMLQVMSQEDLTDTEQEEPE